ncbi:ArsR/SmtB family transcription factor [Dolichospermum circinale]|uniref:ArsR/SmtB family transcription factor n=1 Tax=Dolichospermum circinale TaxID=109265 RepID=UPI00040871FE|nr:metalloregulator ArsR/SmtB family transcription factor [Dolichospermum circinale]MDB9484020.1 metalloregulator ArsR/SmtB family transcription factor [Dolichospermum circinale CS-537/05]MDB9452786.1 metalloregulator ArsR/SmtB family transcription factor [Dolichospermum circinale CS-541/06]MDB9464005.1 metalloregulator ArsR/SmtB family transcription factor [Dolichospermum circinale CS-541/04]MDB9476992.1 metalloregulator ArsR/SmtB family transcription factor [Dolichospermum circinale CS-537/11
MLLNKPLTSPIATHSLIVSGFHALSDPIRISVIELLRQRELCVCDLCDALEINQSKLSFHLKTLKEASLVNSRQQGRWIYYSLNISQFQVLETYLAEFHLNYGVLTPRSCCE